MRTQSSSSALWITSEVVQKSLGEDEFGAGQAVAQHVELIDRQIIAVPRVDLHQSNTTAIELELAQALDHHLGVAAIAAVAHVLHRHVDAAAHGFRVRAAHGVDHGRLAFERDQHVAAQRVPFPMAGQPQHAAAKTPVARAAGNDDGVELVRAHFRAQRRIAAGIFGGGELLVDRVAVVRRVAHVGERQRLVELVADHLPGLRPERPARLFVHGIHSVHLPMVTRPPASSTASLASAILATCSTVGFLAGFDVAVGDAVFDRPLRALRVKAFIDRPHAILGLDFPGVFDRFLRLLRRFHHDRNDLVSFLVDGAVGFDHRGDRIAQQRAVAAIHSVDAP